MEHSGRGADRAAADARTKVGGVKSTEFGGDSVCRNGAAQPMKRVGQGGLEPAGSARSAARWQAPAQPALLAIHDGGS